MENKTKNKTKLIVFDMDETLFHETLYEQVFGILEEISKKNIHMAIASYNKFCTFFCDRYDISKYFDVIRGYYAPNKINHFNEIFDYYNKLNIQIKPSEVLFFDDDNANLETIRGEFNITSYKVEPNIGITNDILKLIKN